MSAQKSLNKKSGAPGKSYSGKNHGSNRKHLNYINPNHYTYLAIPLLLIIALVPLIVYVKKVILNDPGNLYWNGQNERYDIFSYYKMVYLLIFAGAGLLLYLLMKKGNPFEKVKRPYYIPTGIFALLALASAIASDYKQVAFFGFIERYEGAVVLIVYCVILFLAMNVFQDEKSIKIMFGCLFASATVISILGIFQYCGINYFDSSFISQLITPPYLLKLGGSIKPNMEGNLIYSTLYNPNYVGSYTAMLIPISVILLIWFKKIWQKLAISTILLLTLINLIGSQSFAGLIGTGFAVVILLIIYKNDLWAHKWITLSAILILIAGTIAVNFAAKGALVNRLVNMMTGNAEIVEAQKSINNTLAGLSDVKMDDRRLQLVTNKGTLVVLTQDLAINVMDENNAVIPSKFDNNTLTFSDKRFENIKIAVKPDEGMMNIFYNNFQLLDVAFTKDGLRSPTNRWLNYRNDREIQAFGFKGVETFGSNRGYIWSRSIPQLKDTILLGHGPDTFAIYFPQYDFLSKLRFYLTGSIFVDKAHNLYLQTALNTGVLSLLALLALFVMYFISSIKLYFKSNSVRTNFFSTAGAACFTAFCGYVVAALANDSVVSVAPVFWVLLGLGIGINVKLAKETADGFLQKSSI
ncbi:MAG TPA: O-antigen ligase family protein [Clostridia bacterium]|nr:O-antigen ligase family protein [Clostridia bacterium]